MFLLSSGNNFLLHVIGEERVLHQSSRMGSSPSCAPVNSCWGEMSETIIDSLTESCHFRPGDILLCGVIAAFYRCEGCDCGLVALRLPAVAIPAGFYSYSFHA